MSHLETRIVKTAGLLTLGLVAAFAAAPSPAAAGSAPGRPSARSPGAPRYRAGSPPVAATCRL